MSSDQRGSRNAPTRSLLGPRLVATFLVALGIVLIVSALNVARGGGYQLIGPGTIPLVVAIGVTVLAGLFLARTTLVPDLDVAERAAAEEAATHWPTVGLAALALVAYALALNGFKLGTLAVPGLGYVVATGLFLPAAAWALGSRSPLRDVVIGFALGLVIYIGFTQFLGIRLPAGILGGVL